MKRKFILGEEWVYYKVFCGKRTADRILSEIIKPLTIALLDANAIDKWFFIRYTDPEPHIRLRFHLAKNTALCEVIEKVKNAFAECLEDGTIWYLQTDTYSRELERYGTSVIEESEQLFYLDSQFCVNALNLIEEDELLFLLTLRSIDDLLNGFDLEIDQRVTFTKQNFNGFKKEFEADKALNRQLNLKYSGLRESIHQFMTSPKQEYAPLLQLLEGKKREMRKVIGSIAVGLINEPISLDSYLSSQVHMAVNRVFRDQQRLHELVVYSCLYRYYQQIKSAKA